MQLKQNVCFPRVLNEPYSYDEVVDAGCDKYGGKKGGGVEYVVVKVEYMRSVVGNEG